MKRFGIICVTLFLVAGACAKKKNSKNSESSPEEAATSADFKILSKANLVTRDNYILKWSEFAPGKSYTITVGRTKDCKSFLVEKPNISEQEISLDFLRDGVYFLCVYTFNAGKKVGAMNNGIALTLDRSPPLIEAPEFSEAVPLYRGAFQPAIAIEDLTPVSINWSQISGPGVIHFDDVHVPRPQVVASAEGFYTIRVVMKDSAGNATESIYQFAWAKPLPADLIVDRDLMFEKRYYQTRSTKRLLILSSLLGGAETMKVGDTDAFDPLVLSNYRGPYAAFQNPENPMMKGLLPYNKATVVLKIDGLENPAPVGVPVTLRDFDVFAPMAVTFPEGKYTDTGLEAWASPIKTPEVEKDGYRLTTTFGLMILH